MSYSAPATLPLPRHSIDTRSLAPYFNSVSSGVWPTANTAIYVPILVNRTVVALKLWYESSTTATGNIDIGLYDAAGTRLVSSGSTAKSADNGAVYVDITNTTLQPGSYYVALACSNNTDTFNRSVPSAPQAAAFGILSEASALPLPATATPVVPQTLGMVPIIGIIATSVL